MTGNRRFLWCLPALALLAACGSPTPYSKDTYVAPPPAPVVVTTVDTTGALGGAPAYAVASIAAAPAAVVVAPVPPYRMSAADVVASLTNNTASGIGTAGTAYYVYFLPDGRQRFRQGYFTDVGTWRVLADGSFCSRLTQINGGAEQCYSLYRNGTAISFQYLNGAPAGAFTVLAGDPQGL